MIANACKASRERLENCGFKVVKGDINFRNGSVAEPLEDSIADIVCMPPESPIIIASHGTRCHVNGGKISITDNGNTLGFCSALAANNSAYDDLNLIFAARPFIDMLNSTCKHPIMVDACHAGALPCSNNDNILLSCRDTQFAWTAENMMTQTESAFIDLACDSINSCAIFDRYDVDHNGVLSGDEFTRAYGGQLSLAETTVGSRDLVIQSDGLPTSTDIEIVQFIEECREDGGAISKGETPEPDNDDAPHYCRNVGKNIDGNLASSDHYFPTSVKNYNSYMPSEDPFDAAWCDQHMKNTSAAWPARCRCGSRNQFWCTDCKAVRSTDIIMTCKYPLATPKLRIRCPLEQHQSPVLRNMELHRRCQDTL